MIQKRGSRWRVVVQGPRDELTRRRHQLSGSAATEREAVALERSLRLQVERGAAGRATLAQVVQAWWESPTRLAPTTLANYRMNLDRHILPHLGDSMGRWSSDTLSMGSLLGGCRGAGRLWRVCRSRGLWRKPQAFVGCGF